MAPPPTPDPYPGCVDKATYCDSYKQYCKEKVYIEYLKKSCKRSCNYCRKCKFTRAFFKTDNHFSSSTSYSKKVVIVDLSLLGERLNTIIAFESSIWAWCNKCLLRRNVSSFLFRFLLFSRGIAFQSNFPSSYFLHSNLILLNRSFDQIFSTHSNDYILWSLMMKFSRSSKSVIQNF